MKTVNFIFSLAIAAFLSSSMPMSNHSLKIGEEAPALNLSSTSKKSLDSLKGKYVIVTFWSSADASSRMANKKLSALAENASDDNTEYISVCIDEDSQLAQEIAKADHISSKVNSLSVSDLTPKVIEDYQISSGCRSFFIDPYGSLISITTDPTACKA